MLRTWNAVSTLDRMLDDVMGSAFGTATNHQTFEPAVDVRMTENEVVFHCDVPGVKQENLDVTVADRVLTIKGTREFESRENEQVVLGRAYGSFARSFTLSDTLDDEHLSASLADGVLIVRIPKHPKAKPRKIQIGTDPKQLEE